VPAAFSIDVERTNMPRKRCLTAHIYSPESVVDGECSLNHLVFSACVPAEGGLRARPGSYSPSSAQHSPCSFDLRPEDGVEVC
jgi:hypothetical protein